MLGKHDENHKKTFDLKGFYTYNFQWHFKPNVAPETTYGG